MEYGNVQFKEFESDDTQDVRISIRMKASSIQLLEQLEQKVSPRPNNEYSYDVQINERNDKSRKKRLLRRNCARADITVMYPRLDTRKLRVSLGNGELDLRMSPLDKLLPTTTITTRPPVRFEEMELKLVNGGILFDNLIVSKNFHAEIANGRIRGQVHAAGKVAAKATNGQVKLGVDTEPMKEDWDASGLSVIAENSNGEIIVNMVRPFLGHFRLSTVTGTSNLHQLGDRKNIIKFSRKRPNALAGWISQDGLEPVTATPNVDLDAVNGVITLTVGS
ncbi:hypothetical protein B0O80DRAFT_426767 [Mortierella sp. GBAus27b]|nr:hypothetical protein BGX31_009238 [Mortierella sp. GBA43]KAI8353943.1 hypothetical protein B0O80DRAFT_426767 [Mortierella sp. GBAus27b]